MSLRSRIHPGSSTGPPRDQAVISPLCRNSRGSCALEISAVSKRPESVDRDSAKSTGDKPYELGVRVLPRVPIEVNEMSDEWTGNLSSGQRRQLAACLKLDFWSLEECERLELALGIDHGVSVTTQCFDPELEDDLALDGCPWNCDLRFEDRYDQPPPQNISGRGPDRTSAVLSAAWAAFEAGEFDS